MNSGSYVMPYVLADQHSWLEERKDPFDFKVLNTFENMINSVRYVMVNIPLIHVETEALLRLCGSISRLKNTTTQAAFDILAISIPRTFSINFG